MREPTDLLVKNELMVHYLKDLLMVAGCQLTGQSIAGLADIQTN